MTELSTRKERDREGSQLQQLEMFLREQSADNILFKIQGMPLEEALENIVKEGSDELVTELIDEHPWVLGKKQVAWYIAQYRGDEVSRHMIDTHPEVLEDTDVPLAIAYRGDEVSRHMIDTHPEVLQYWSVAWAIAKYRSDEVCMDMIKKHPEVLKYKEVSWAIPEYRSDKVSMYIIDNYPEMLKYVAWGIARYRSDEVFIYMIKKHPEMLKDKDMNVEIALEIAVRSSDKVRMYVIKKHPEVLNKEYVAEDIAEHGSDKEIVYMIKKRPDVLRMDRLIYNLAFYNNLKALTYFLLGLGEIKPNDMELITSQFSVMLSELDDDYKEKVMKQIFHREAIDYGKELNSMGPLYLTLLDMLNISKESAERLAKELSKAEGNVRKALPLRGLTYALVHKNGSEMLNHFIKNSKSVMNALNIFPTVCELRRMNIIDDSEFQQISNSEDKEAELFKRLADKVERAFNVRPESEDAIKAMSDYEFLDDLFGLYAKYHEYSKPAEIVLMNVAKHYFEYGVKGFKEFKFDGHELAREQLSDAYTIRDKLMDLDKLAVTYTSKHSIPFDSVENEMINFMQHKDKALMIFERINEYANAKLSEIAKSAKSKELADLLNAKDLDGLTRHAFDPDDERVKAKGIALIKLLNARDALDYISDIVNELQKMSGKPKEEQDIHMVVIANRIQDWVENKGLEPLKMLKDYISKINEQQINGINKEELSNALANAFSIVDVLLNYSKTAGGATVTAQITFDPSKILTFGRYGSSGAGNCQNSKGNVIYNQSLMSMLGDANQFMIMFQKANDTTNDTTRPLGFMQVHLLKSKEKGMIFFMENPYTNEPDKTTAMKEAASMLAQKIKNETGFDCFTYGEVGDKIEELEVEVPESYVQRYIDFARALKEPESFKYKISAKCLTSHSLFGLKRE